MFAVTGSTPSPLMSIRERKKMKNRMSGAGAGVSLVLMVAVLVSCGGSGGGGGGSGGAGLSGGIYYQTPVAIGTYQALAGSGILYPDIDIYAMDLNKDDVDELIIAGRKQQPASAVDWQDFNMQIFGWNTGSFTNETSSWFSGTDNVITGAGYCVRFGDFDGDTHIDFITCASTGDGSGSVYAQTLVFYNNGDNTFTRTEVACTDCWQDDLLVHDFDGDGLDDFLATDYGANTLMGFGQANRTFTLHTAPDASFSAASVSVADYIAGDDGITEIMMTDLAVAGDPAQDTRLFSWSVLDPDVTGTLTLTDSGKTLPATPDANFDHGIRNVAMDFDGDSDMDVIVFQRHDNFASLLQFLQNDGAGNFTDVTGTVLVAFAGDNPWSNDNPQLTDFNGDGLMDIYLTGFDYGSPYDATQVLLQSSDGKFVSSFGHVFADFAEEIVWARLGKTPNTLYLTSSSIRLVSGPDGVKFLASNSFESNDFAEVIYATLYMARVGNPVAQVPQTAAELATVEWPF